MASCCLATTSMLLASLFLPLRPLLCVLRCMFMFMYVTTSAWLVVACAVSLCCVYVVRSAWSPHFFFFSFFFLFTSHPFASHFYWTAEAFPNCLLKILIYAIQPDNFINKFSYETCRRSKITLCMQFCFEMKWSCRSFMRQSVQLGLNLVDAQFRNGTHTMAGDILYNTRN